MIRRQAPDIPGLSISVMPRSFLFPAKPKVLSRRGLALPFPFTEIRRQSKTRLPAHRHALSRPRQQLLLLLTKVPAAQSQGKEVVTLELVEDLLPHLFRELVQTLGVLGLPRVAVDLLPGTKAARDRRSLSLRHLPSLRGDMSTDKKLALAHSLDRSRVCSSSLVLGLPFPRRREGRLARRCRSPAPQGCRECSRKMIRKRYQMDREAGEDA